MNKNWKKQKKKVVSRQKKTSKQRKSNCKHRLHKFEKYQLVSRLSVVINRHFPNFYQELAELPDYRTRPIYEVKELIMSGVLMFLFKQKSRNQADGTAKNLDYQDNIKRIFGVNVADMDTVDKYLRRLSTNMLEDVKHNMFREIIKSKTFKKYRYQDKYYLLAIDGSGLHSYSYEPYPECPYKESKKTGKRVWTTYVLEAKVVTHTGFAISLFTEWIENPVGMDYNKQDCEHNAFKRMAVRIKKEYPRLPLTLLLDGLYTNDPIFNICKSNAWKFIITLKDKNLKSVQQEISDKLLFKDYQKDNNVELKGSCWINYDYKFFTDIKYRTHKLSVIETIREKKHKVNEEKEITRFVHITNIDICLDNLQKTSKTGRLRWKIENEGFNAQKNNDYNLEHKFSHTNFNATKNYYQLLQIASIINQFTYKLLQLKVYMKEYGLTENCLINEVLAYLKAMIFNDIELIETILSKSQQLRY